MHCKKIEVYMNKFMNRFFFLPPLILKLPGFVLFCFIQQRELQPALGYSPFLTLSRCPLVLTVCELWLLSVPPPHPNIGVTSICFFYQSKKKKKKKRLASYKINPSLLSGNVHGLPALSKARIQFGIQK